MKKLSILFLIFLLCGCASYERRVNLSPRGVPGWEKNRSGFYEATCGEGGVRLTEIVLRYDGGGDMPFFIPIPAATKSDLEKVNKEDAWQYVEFFRDKYIDSCDKSFVFLKDRFTGKIFYSTGTEDLGEVMVLNKHHRACYYYFDLPKESKAGYNLYVSDDVLNCRITPLPLDYDKSFEVIPMQMM